MLEVEGLQAEYGPITAVRGVSFRVDDGAAVAILGRNGAGKSTTLNVLSGMKDASRGSVRYEGRNLLKLSPEQRLRQGVALVPEGRGIFRSLSVRENLQVGAFPERLSSKAMDARIDEVTQRFPRLVERMTQRAGSLSGGEAQMLAVARGLMSRPRLLLLDEPSLGLAPVFVQELYELFKQVRQGGTTLLLVEQYAQVALKFTDHAHVFRKGEIALSEQSSRLRGNDELLKAYMSADDDVVAA